MRKQIHILEGIIILIVIIISFFFLIKFIYTINHENLDTSYMWNINFANLKINDGSAEGDLNLIDNKINLDITLQKDSEYFSFTIDIVNDGSLDAQIESINLNVENPANILAYSITYSNQEPLNVGDILKSNSSKTILINISYPPQKNKIYDSLNLKLALDISYTAIY